LIRRRSHWRAICARARAISASSLALSTLASLQDGVGVLLRGQIVANHAQLAENGPEVREGGSGAVLVAHRLYLNEVLAQEPRMQNPGATPAQITATISRALAVITTMW
jgi:hypothetical protein